MMAWSGNPRATINSVWQWIAYAAMFFLARQWMVSLVAQRAFCTAMLALAVALSGLGYYQYFVSMPETRARYLEDPAEAMRQANLGEHADPQLRELFRNRVMSVEPIATFALTNSLAAFLTPWLVLGAGAAFIAVRHSAHAKFQEIGRADNGLSRKWITRPGKASNQPRVHQGEVAPHPPRSRRMLLGWLVALVVIGGCFFLTKSRASWAAASCGIALAVYCGREGASRSSWRLVVLVAIGVVAMVLGTLLVGGLDVQVLSEAPKSLLYRLEYWQATAQMIRDHPLWGVGVGNFQNYYTSYKLPQASETVADPHNFLFEIWATAGTPALGAFLLILATAAWRFRRGGAASDEVRQSVEPAREPQPSEDDGSPLAVYLGALVGVLLAYPLGLAAQYPPDPMFLITGVPLGVACAYLIDPWTRQGALPPVLIAVAIAALLLNLMAAGGIGFAAVATSFWLMLAFVLNGRGESDSVRVVGQGWCTGLALAALGLIAACYATAYRPTLEASALMHEAADAVTLGRMEEAKDKYLAAAQADRLARDPWKELASLALRQSLGANAPQALEDFENAWQEAVRRDAHSFALWKMIGDWYTEAYRATTQPALLQSAVDAYRQALSLYPNNARLHAELAWRLALAGDAAGAATSADTALRLDQRHPHQEYKLGNFPAPLEFDADNLEHLAKKLRKLDEDETGASLGP